MRKIIKKVVRKCGFDIVRFKNSPERTLLGLKQEPIRSIIDVGSNRGQFARRISQFFPEGRIYCFEPLAEPFSDLSEWADTQDGRVQCFRTALGDKEGEVSMYRHDNHTASSSLLPSTDYFQKMYPKTTKKSVETVHLTTLDEIFGKQLAAIPRKILLKLDVQGFEHHVLQGGSKTLPHVSACIVEVGIDLLYENQADFFVLTEILHEYGLSYAGNLDQTYDSNGRVIWLDAVYKKTGNEN